MEDRVVIGYTASANRFYNFDAFCKNFNNVKSKDSFHLLVMVHEPDFVSQFNMVLNSNHVSNASVHYLPDSPNSHNYLNKIRFLVKWASDNKYKYTIKLDNDIFFHSSVLDYMFDNRELVADPWNTKVMSLAPTLSTGIPGCDYFMKDFFTPDEISEMNELFRQHTFGELWGFDYSFLNSLRDKWDVDRYRQALIDSPIYYKGIHPVRVNNAIQKRFNEIVLNHKDKLHTPNEYYLYQVTPDVYHCNGFVMTLTEVYKNFVEDASLYVDPFEEVPFNRYCVNNGWNKMYVGNAFVLHNWYNTYPNHHYEEYIMFNKLYS